MEAILKHLELQLSSNKNGQRLELMFINNPNGSPRWIWNAKSTKPFFLKFYSVNSFKSKVFEWMLQLIFILKLQKWCFKTSTFYVRNGNHKLNQELNLFKSNWALFTGTIGPNNKLVGYKLEKGKGSFYKIAPNNQVTDLLQNEVHSTYKLDLFKIKSFDYPKADHIGRNVIKLSDVSLKDRANQFSLAHSLALGEIYNHTQKSTRINELPAYQKTQNLLHHLNTKKDSRIPIGLLKKIELLLKKQENKNIQVAMSHGDFTPWNSFINNDRIAIYDWELSSPHMPIGHDAFHFIMQQGILVNHQSWTQIKSQIFQIISKKQFKIWMNSDDFGSKHIQDYLELYLIFNTVYYLDIYSNQPQWHEQIHWLIKVWSAAISDMLQSNSNHRQILIMDIFDFLRNKSYGTIKFPEFAPENLSEYSDIDMCIHKKNAQHLIRFLSSHSMTSEIKIISYSYMNSVQILLKDQSILSLDLIWEFKRKSLYMLDFKQIISRCYVNSFGVKKIKQLDLARFIGLFYILNGQSVPVKFKAYEMLLSKSQFLLDRLLYKNFAFNDYVHHELLHYLNQQNKNQGFSKLLSIINYLRDCISKALSTKGLIITFSGVDGAGKSTVIENVKYKIEKNLRKPVVVIRHRPSLLPIISAWVKGKEQAEKDSINTLPRQGSNDKFWSSLFRFGYYYADYVFGQFYILFKYQIKGYVVLYDRYYFDFINDSKRSNIQLPKNIIKLGYNLLFTPDLNFFLYADPDVVLSRKKELDKETIQSLTSDYLNLFENLDQNQKNTYFNIENLQLDHTIDQIMEQTAYKLTLAS
jgi:thymidylate kinase